MKTILVDAFNTFVIKDAGINEEMHAMLEEYPNRKIVLTNANDEEKITLGLDSVPYEMFTLNHDPDKIDPRYYETMLQHFGLDRKEVVYFEHNEDAVKSAQSVGISTYHYDKDKKDLAGLKNFLDNNL